jgi:hypothetical protein
MIEKAVQTFWINDEKHLHGGWLNTKFHLLGWGLSALSFSKFFQNLELITDALGKDILIDQLQLPYTSVSLAQENFQPANDKIWVLRKIYSYSLQNEPFLHVDGDAFLFSPFDDAFLNSPLLAQNIEYDFPNYWQVYEQITNKCNYLPAYLKKDTNGKLSAANAGIVGGNNYSFFKDFAKEIDTFLEKNRTYISSLTLPAIEFNIFLEQFLLKKLADQVNIPINAYLKEPITYPYKSYFMDQFWMLPHQSNFCHLMSYKRNPTTCEQLAQRLYIESPELYERIIKVAHKLDSKNYSFTQYSVSTTSVPDNFFYRTFSMAQALGFALHATNVMEDFITSINESIALLPANEGSARLKDVWQYELEKYLFISTIPTAEQYQQYRKEQSLITNNKLNSSLSEILQQPISFGKYFSSIESRWKWVENNEFTAQNEKGEYTFDYLTNLSAQPSYFIVLLLIYPEQMHVKEHLLSPLNIFILNTLLESTQSFKIEEVINRVIDDIKHYDSSINREKYSEEIFSQLRYWLYQGVLVFS